MSALKIAHLPWDPAPEPVRQPPTVPSNVKVDNEIPPSSGPVNADGGYQQPIPNYPQAQPATNGYNGGYDQNSQLAQQRAAALIQQRVQQQGNVHQQNYPNMPQQGHLPQMPMQGQQQRMMAPQQQQHHHQQQQQQMPHQQTQQQQMQQQRPPHQTQMYPSQTDGPDDALADWEAFKAARAASAVERMAADDFMRARVDAMAMRQDSGLMVPLDSMPKGKKRKAAVRVLQAEDAAASTSVPPPARFDGDDDVKLEEDPDDAISDDGNDYEDNYFSGGENDFDDIGGDEEAY